jgi:hypothetical protein
MNSQKRPAEDKIYCTLTQAEAFFITKTRLLTKKRKFWQSKKKPKQVKDKEDVDKLEKEVIHACKNMKNECVYCGKVYKGRFEDYHYQECPNSFMALTKEENFNNLK